MYDVSYPLYLKLQEIGRVITQHVKPNAVFMISAHWQEESNVIKVNVTENADLTSE